MNNFLTIKDISQEELNSLLATAKAVKNDFKDGKKNKQLDGKILAMIFDKPSTRTRVSFESGMLQTGGHAILLSPGSVGLGKRESIADVARTLSRMVDGIIIRTFSHELIEELAKYADIPVINGLTDWAHPCQALADVMTINEFTGKTDGVKMTYIGDGNNVARSLAYACKLTGIKLTVCAPPDYQFDKESIRELEILTETEPAKAVKQADFIYTDVWASMGQESEEAKRKKIFLPYQVNESLIKSAPNHVKILHCLPAHRGLEITDKVIDSEKSIVFDQAENRLHAQKAVLIQLMS